MVNTECKRRVYSRATCRKTNLSSANFTTESLPKAGFSVSLDEEKRLPKSQIVTFINSRLVASAV